MSTDRSPEQRAFAARLAAARKVHGLTQTDLAALLGVSLPRYHSCESATASPNRIELYRKVCLHLHVTMDWLFFGSRAGLSVEMAEKLYADKKIT